MQQLEIIEYYSAWADGTRGFMQLIALGALLTASGCASAATGKGPSSPERTAIAPGVELVLAADAGPSAQRIAAEIQSKYASELITARPAAPRRWPLY